MSYDVASIRAASNLIDVAGTATKLVKSGSEYRGTCPIHGGDNPSAFVVYTDSKDVHRWSCYTHGCHENEAGSDVIGFVMALRGIGFKEACEYLGGTHEWKPVIAMPPKPKQAQWQSTKPPHGSRPETLKLSRLGEPVMVWEYKDTDGELLSLVARYETDEGKEYRPFTYGSDGTQPPGWAVHAASKPRPLYGLDRLGDDRQVVICEGEKAADAAAQILQASACIAWPAGASAWPRADWSQIKGRKVVIWPDNDEAGLKAGRELALTLSDPENYGCSVRLIVPADVPAGFDAADALEQWGTEKSFDWLKSCITDFNPPKSADVIPIQQPPIRPAPRLATSGNTALAPDEDEEPLPLALSEHATAVEFANRYTGVLAVAPDLSPSKPVWFVWRNGRWQIDNTRTEPMALMKSLCVGLPERREARDMTGTAKLKFGQKRYITNCLDLAESERPLLATYKQFDADPWLLGTPGGTVDLKTGQLMPATPTHWLTQQCSVTPAQGEHPLFDKVLGRASGGDPEMLAYLWRCLGYALSGDQREECFWFLYGKPQSGKTTLIEAIAGILGDVRHGGYASPVDMELFTETRSDRGNERMIELHGLRFGYASETDEGRHWKAAAIKLATGGDTMQGRQLYQVKTAWRPTHHLWIFGNHRPHLRQRDDGVKRRLHLLEYPGVITDAERDNTLKERLRAEYPAILYSMIQGCLDWQRNGGLGRPASIAAAVDDYMDSEDSMQAWLDECAEIDANAKTASGELYANYRQWCERNGEGCLSQKRFTAQLEEKNFPRKRSNGVRYMGRLRLKQSATAGRWDQE